MATFSDSFNYGTANAGVSISSLGGGWSSRDGGGNICVDASGTTTASKGTHDGIIFKRLSTQNHTASVRILKTDSRHGLLVRSKGYQEEIRITAHPDYLRVDCQGAGSSDAFLRTKLTAPLTLRADAIGDWLLVYVDGTLVLVHDIAFSNSSVWNGVGLFNHMPNDTAVKLADDFTSEDTLGAVVTASVPGEARDGSANGTVVGKIAAFGGIGATFALTAQSVAAFAVASDGTVTVADGSLLDHHTHSHYTLTVDVTNNAVVTSHTVIIPSLPYASATIQPVATIDIGNLSAHTQTDGEVCFRHSFPKGVIPSNFGAAAARVHLAGGVVCQQDAETYWADGSLRAATLSLVLPKVRGYYDTPLPMYWTDLAPDRTPVVSIATIKSESAYNVRVHGSTAYDTSPDYTINGEFRVRANDVADVDWVTYREGPNCVEYAVEDLPLVNSSTGATVDWSSAEGQLTFDIYVRRWKTGRTEINVRGASGYISHPKPRHLHYNCEIRDNTTILEGWTFGDRIPAVHEVTGQRNGTATYNDGHHQHSSWISRGTRTDGSGGIWRDGVAPVLWPKHRLADMANSRDIQYVGDPSEITDTHVDGHLYRPLPGHCMGFNKSAGSGGNRVELGLKPRNHAHHFHSRTYQGLSRMIGDAKSQGQWPHCWRTAPDAALDPWTLTNWQPNDIVDLVANPTFGYSDPRWDTAGVVQASDNQPGGWECTSYRQGCIWEMSHYPNLLDQPYIVSGESWMIKNIYWDGQAPVICKNQDADNRTVNGKVYRTPYIMAENHSRTTAWSYGITGSAYLNLPYGHAYKARLKTLLEDNLEYWDLHHYGAGSGGNIGFPTDDISGSSDWHVTYACFAVTYLAGRRLNEDMPRLDNILPWLAKFENDRYLVSGACHTTLLTGNNFAYRWKNADGTHYTDWSVALPDLYAQRGLTACPTLTINYESYALTNMSCVRTGIELGLANSTEAWAVLEPILVDAGLVEAMKTRTHWQNVEPPALPNYTVDYGKVASGGAPPPATPGNGNGRILYSTLMRGIF